MTRKRIATVCFLVIAGLGAASVFGGDLGVLVEKIPSMFVTNDLKHPVPTRELGDPGRSVFLFFEQGTLDEDIVARTEVFFVPKGKRLVIESVSLKMRLPAGQSMTDAHVQVNANGVTLLHDLPSTFNGSSSGRSVFVASGERTLYADEETQVTLLAGRNDGAGTASYLVSLSGHLIDCQLAACE